MSPEDLESTVSDLLNRRAGEIAKAKRAKANGFPGECYSHGTRADDFEEQALAVDPGRTAAGWKRLTAAP